MDKLLVYLAIFITLVGSCVCIQCHQCAMVGGDDCGDFYDGDANADNVDDCGDKDTHCTKFKTVVKIGDSGYINGVQRPSTIITRGCERAAGSGDSCSITQADGGVIIKCRCSTDGCNSANTLFSRTSSILAAILSVTVIALCRS